jgi:hypothetical protein
VVNGFAKALTYNAFRDTSSLMSGYNTVYLEEIELDKTF